MIPTGAKGCIYFIISDVKNRYVFDKGSILKGPVIITNTYDTAQAVSSAFNYGNRAAFKISRIGNSSIFENVVTHRCLLGDGDVVDTSKRGAENGWVTAPGIYTVDGCDDLRNFWTLVPMVCTSLLSVE